MSDFKPEITKGTTLYGSIFAMVERLKPKTILEIGSATGLGSTQAFIDGVYKLYSSGQNYFPKMVCLELYEDRYKELRKNTEPYRWVTSLRASSIKVSEGYSDIDIDNFLKQHPEMTITKLYADRVHGWRKEELCYIIEKKIDQNGIDQAKDLLGEIDMVLIDGSAFTASAELDKVYGAKCIILDDILDIKNYDNYKRLDDDVDYRLSSVDEDERNGWAIFLKEGK